MDISSSEEGRSEGAEEERDGKPKDEGIEFKVHDREMEEEGGDIDR